LAVLAGNCLAGSYFTTFTNSEALLSEEGRWINGNAGLEWSNCFTAGGVVHGRQNNGAGPSYNDSTALLAGSWGSTQSVTVTLYKASVVESDYPEVEIRLRSSLSPHSCTGYEVTWSLRTDQSCYVGITKWNGSFGDFTNVATVYGSQYVVTNGSILSATARGNVISAYVNGIRILTGIDNTFTTGSPGIGFDHNGPGSEDAGFGFTRFHASDSLHKPAPPQNLHVVH